MTNQKLQDQNLDLLDFNILVQVDVDTAVVPGNTDQVDLNVSVTERNTGKIMVGAGVSSAEGLMGSFNVSQRNFAGSGNTLALGCKHRSD